MKQDHRQPRAHQAEIELTGVRATRFQISTKPILKTAGANIVRSKKRTPTFKP